MYKTIEENKDLLKFNAEGVEPSKMWYNATTHAVKAVDDYMADKEEAMYCGFANVSIHPARGKLVSWRPIMHQWCENYKKTEFFYDHELPMMADKIVSGEPMDLTLFNFGLTEESLLMMYVMKRHGRRLILPTDHFPKNTLDLHRFLK